jgi:flavorubredoxin
MFNSPKQQLKQNKKDHIAALTDLAAAQLAKFCPGDTLKVIGVNAWMTEAQRKVRKNLEKSGWNVSTEKTTIGVNWHITEKKNS